MLTLRDQWVVITVAVALTVAGAVANTLLEPDQYEATAEVLVSPVGGGTLSGLPVFRTSASGSSVVAAARFANSDVVARRVRADLNLSSLPVAEVIGLIRVTPQEQRSVVAMTARAARPDDATRIANSYARALLTEQSERFRTQSRRLVDRLSKELRTVDPRVPRAMVLSDRIDAYRALYDQRDPTLKLLSRASVPSDPAGPTLLASVAIAVVIGLGVGVATAVFLELGRAIVSRPEFPGVLPSAITGCVMLLAIVSGLSLGKQALLLAVAGPLAATFLLLVSVQIAVAIAAWTALLHFSQWAALGRLTAVMGILIGLAWLGAGGVRRGRLPALRSNAPLVGAIVLLGCWLTLSMAWASDVGRSAGAVRDWWLAILVFVVVATALTASRDVVYVALAFVGGAALAVLLGLVGVGNILDPTAADESGRLQAAGDPNYQAAAFLAAIFVAGGLMGVLRRPAARVVLLVALAVITVGFFATQSRGGLVALGVALVAAVVLFRRQRRAVLGLAAIGVLSLAVWLPTRPEVLDRLTTFGGGGSGRLDLWTVAWRIFAEHPVAGVGLGNFQALEARYVLEPGGITHVQLISETPNVVHNAYLGLLAETGVVGLACFCVVAGASLHASWQAAHHFDAIGAFDQGNLARALLVGTIGMLAAMFFISNVSDLRLWVLFAMGVVLKTVAERSRSDLEQEGLHEPASPAQAAP